MIDSMEMFAHDEATERMRMRHAEQKRNHHAMIAHFKRLASLGNRVAKIFLDLFETYKSEEAILKEQNNENN